MPRQLTQTIKLIVILFIPILVIGGVVNVLATDQFIAYEYGKPGFPPDTFGFTPQLRFMLASTNIHYVRAHLPSDELAKQTLNGTSVFNAREVSHMADVQVVFQTAMRVWQAILILVVLTGSILFYQGEGELLASAVRSGGLLTVVIVVAIATLGIFAWQFWFEIFHSFFFKPGSWLFSYSDALIRLFPEKFWFDSTLTISVLSFAGGLLAIWIGSRWHATLEKASLPQALT